MDVTNLIGKASFWNNSVNFSLPVVTNYLNTASSKTINNCIIAIIKSTRTKYGFTYLEAKEYLALASTRKQNNLLVDTYNIAVKIHSDKYIDACLTKSNLSISIQYTVSGWAKLFSKHVVCNEEKMTLRINQLSPVELLTALFTIRLYIFNCDTDSIAVPTSASLLYKLLMRAKSNESSPEEEALAIIKYSDSLQALIGLPSKIKQLGAKEFNRKLKAITKRNYLNLLKEHSIK